MQHQGGEQTEAHQPEQLTGALQEGGIAVHLGGTKEDREVARHVNDHECHEHETRDRHDDFLAYGGAVQRDQPHERYSFTADIGSRTACALFSSALRSSAVNCTSITRSTPLRPSLHRTPRNTSRNPYSPCSPAAPSRIRL